MTSKKKITLAAVLVLVMVISAVGGTLAYLTDSASLDNTFLVGAFTPPTEPKPDPDPPKPDPDDPDPTPTDPTVFGTPTTFIYEPYWNANASSTYTNEAGTVTPDHHRLLAGDTTVKDPYIGIGKDSESGYVLAAITNPMKPYVYFTLGKGWKPVEGYVTEVTINTAEGGNGQPEGVTAGTKFYSEGLFKWVGVDEGDNTKAGEDLDALTPGTDVSTGEKTDAWTDHPVFSYVYTAKNGLDAVKALEKEDQKMTVWAYIAQSEGTQEGSEAAITSDYVIGEAKTWATTKDSKHPSLDYTAAP